eukprot:3805937-Alexandrium_andersonii.AAC.1
MIRGMGTSRGKHRVHRRRRTMPRGRETRPADLDVGRGLRGMPLGQEGLKATQIARKSPRPSWWAHPRYETETPRGDRP